MNANPKCHSALVIGGAGFIGSHLAETLVYQGIDVTVVDNLMNGYLENLQTIQDQIAFYPFDICTVDFTDFLLNHKFDVVFHLAGNAYVPPSIDNPRYDFQTNLVASFSILETLRQIPVDDRPIFIVASSAAVYGNPTHIPISEMDVTIPISPYGVDKLAVERFVYVYHQLYCFKAASLRFFSVYGPRQKKQIVYDFIRKISNNPNELELLGDGTQMRDLVYVEDVVQAILTVMKNAPLQGEVYNVAAGKSFSTTQIAEAVSSTLKLHPRFNYTGSIRPGDADRWEACIEKISRLGFCPSVSLEQGIQRTVDWYASQ